MNILLINHYAGSPAHGMEYRPYYFARQWINAGHDVTILAATYSHLRSTQPAAHRAVTTEMIDGIRYIWFRTPAYEGNSPQRVLNMLSFTAQLWMRHTAGVSFDLVIDSSTYPLTIFSTHHIARKHSARLVFEVHDLWPLSPIELGRYSRRHPYIMAMQYAEDFAYRKSHRVVSFLPKAKEYMMSRGMAPDKFVYIPNGIDTSAWNTAEPLPAAHTELFRRLRHEGKFVVGYTGAHAIANALDTLIRAAGLLREDAGIHMVLVGQGQEKEKLMTLAAGLGLDNISFLPAVPKTCMPGLLAEIDVCYIGFQDQPLFRFGISPNKLMDYMMAAKPILHAIKAGNDLVVESGCGISVPPEDPDAVAAAIRTLSVHSPADLQGMGEKGRMYVTANHDYAVLARRFLESM